MEKVLAKNHFQRFTSAVSEVLFSVLFSVTFFFSFELSIFLIVKIGSK